MDRFSNEELFSAILSSNILASYVEQNPELTELLQSPNHPDIHYYENYTQAKEILPALKQRLAHLALKKIDLNRKATQQLVDFLEQYSDSEISNVTFNCPTRHYGVRCGVINNQLHVICVMTGGHIPNELLGESI
jgi:hypothetical protein